MPKDVLLRENRIAPPRLPRRLDGELMGAAMGAVRGDVLAGDGRRHRGVLDALLEELLRDLVPGGLRAVKEAFNH